MARPKNLPKVKFPTGKSPADPNIKCGSNWHTYTTIKIPYRGFGQYQYQLEPISEIDDVEKGLPIGKAGNSAIYTKIKELIKSVNLKKGQVLPYLNSSDRSLIKTVYDRATKYLDAATLLHNYWKNEYALYVATKRGGPLTLAFRGWKLGKFEPRVFIDGVWYTPTLADKSAHKADEKKIIELLRGALINARCAQERLFAAISREENKKYGAAKIVGISIPKKATVVSLPIPTVDVIPTAPPPERARRPEELPIPGAPPEAETEETELVGEGEVVEEEVVPAKKKKGMGILPIVAIGGIALLIRKK
jgi:hypothetical protein